MLKNEIEKLRECLNTMVMEYDFCSKELLKVSRDLDILIVHYLRECSSQE